MSRVQEVLARYAASEALMRDGAQIFAAADPAGAQLNAAIRQTIRTVGDDGLELWRELLSAAKAMRWRRMTQLQPPSFNPGTSEAGAALLREADRLRSAVGSQSVLDDLVAAAEVVLRTDSPVGQLLLSSLFEVGPSDCVVVAASKPAQVGLGNWLNSLGTRVVTAGDLGEVGIDVDQAYVVGPPSFFPSSLVTAPVTDQVTFVIPAWFGDRSVPSSRMGEWADGRIRVEGHLFPVGDADETTTDTSTIGTDEVEDDYFPQPAWGRRESGDRKPTSEEVEAHKILLADGLAMWLDDGDRIRTLDPRQPAGERVAYADVDAIRPGTYLVLRQGSTEHGAMYKAALSLVGGQAASIEASQERWKRALAKRLTGLGYQRTVEELRACGVRAAGRVGAWPEPTLICPQRDADLELLLEWLGIPVQPTYSNAIELRRKLYQASSKLKEELESAVGAGDLAALDRDGHLSLDIKEEGFRGIVALRVLGISPHTEIVPRRECRVPFEAGGSTWLE